MKLPVVETRPILLAPSSDSVNQSAPSGPAATAAGRLAAVGIANSVMLPVIVMRPILSVACSVNHSAPSGPRAIPAGALKAVGGANSVKLPVVVIRPI